MTSGMGSLVDTEVRMQKSIESMSKDMDSIRTGRATPALIEGLMVDYYGTSTPLNQIASISVPEARVLLIQPWDKQALIDIERSVLQSDLGLVPNSDGTVIRINIPILTEERRRDLVRLVGRKVEDGHVAVRNIRRDALERIRNEEKDKKISQDDARRFQQELQKLTDGYVDKMDKLGKGKVDEIMEI